MKKPQVRRIKLLGREETILRAQFAALDRARADLTSSSTMILAREGIEAATVEGMADGVLIVTLPSG